MLLNHDHEDECASNPCPGIQTCEDGLGEYECSCTGSFAGYAGTYCSIDIDECLSTPCLNGGLCLNYVNRYECEPSDCEGECIEFPDGEEYTVQPFGEKSFRSPEYPAHSSSSAELQFTVIVDNSQFSKSIEYHFARLYVYFLSDVLPDFLYSAKDTSFGPLTVRGFGTPPFDSKFNGAQKMTFKLVPNQVDSRFWFKFTTYPLVD
ncbi:protein crumbs homolog 2-like [Strongylocentrotus purpuratus]|uniref:EGF-like domain-containing protein n=1 Tax=Strongylocentrotus purpuratus TaxID=7668 RepID=A0A7M7LSJ1_STRPU|nr:protein crumbs homolog 2-like [Strongylocentrotus purpuratus]|eukprot:XP_011661960.1 PREDICTED: protein crumbs homolog 2-like [Strongylocentrotus purpuratus]